MNQEEYEEGEVEVVLPSWRFSLWDVAGIALHTAAHIAGDVAQGLGLLSREFAAMANNSRQTYDLQQAEEAQREAQEAIGADLRALIEGPGDES